MYEAAASCTDISRASITKWELSGIMVKDTVAPQGTGYVFSL